MTLAEIQTGQTLSGVDAAGDVTVVAVVPLGPEAVTLVYRRADGGIGERLLGAAEAAGVAAAGGREWTFDGDAAEFKLTVEAKRMDLAFLFDPLMAVHTSNVEPLPHQITAVYEDMLPRQPLRFVLADDPGAGKTIMAGLYISELLLRADARRVLIVAPGSLVEQWREELWEKFGLPFRVFSRETGNTTQTGDFFADNDLVIARLDQLARDEEAEGDETARTPGLLQTRILESGWDLAVFDEAHKLAAHYDGNKISRTGRFRFAERLGEKTRHLLLMTATPHNGKEPDFQLFLSLLDSDRFYGKFRDGVHKADASDLLRRMTKETLVRFDGTRLFPERRANTLNYKLTSEEAALYNAVTAYVTDEMGKADALDGKRKGSVGLALTTLQRRVASSPEAIWQSLRNRRERLEKRLREEEIAARSGGGMENGTDRLELEAGGLELEDDDELAAEEREQMEDALVDRATAATSLQELREEIEILKRIEARARRLRDSGVDRKWDELSRLLQSRESELRDAGGRLRKLIIFTEHRATLEYLQARVGSVLGDARAVAAIQGSTTRDERRRIQAEFRSDKDVRVLVATDAAGEGVNLQCANLMVNYDLPWNPNRMEQRFGRIHRIGQTEVCHLWNLVAGETREGDVYHTLLKKLEAIGRAFQGKVFDVLGEIFEDESLKDLLIEAIRHGDRPEARAKLNRKIDDAFDEGKLRVLLERNALAAETMDGARLFAVKAMLEEAEARKLQPYFVRSFFMEAFARLGGSIHGRGARRWEITHVPGLLRERDRRITGRNRRDSAPVLQKYERICFEKEAVAAAKPGEVPAVLLHPGHPLMLSMTDVLLEKHSEILRRGATFLDKADAGETPSVIFLLLHEIRFGKDNQTLSKRLQFIRVRPDGRSELVGSAPHLDLENLPAPDSRPQISSFFPTASSLERAALVRAATELAPAHYEEVKQRHCARVEKTLAAVHERLLREIEFWTDRHQRLAEDREAGKDVRLQLSEVGRRVNDLQARLDARTAALKAEKHVTQGAPVIVGGMFVIPAGLLKKPCDENGPAGDADADGADADDAGETPQWACSAGARARIERLAMEAVMRAERERGNTAEDVSARKCGWDITSQPPAAPGVTPPPARHIEVKGRAAGAKTITLTRNEIFCALNQAEKFWLAVVFVHEDGGVEAPLYKQTPFTTEPDTGAASVNYGIFNLFAEQPLP
ncbi:MAG: DUF3883 domain-containing protein [Opitutaceae bacterium]|jgi:superfamily II DNA or RNA helicase|nr:DUF3883 domain-containing protein [Opitutaceae bacterium]